ncbi:MAG: TonB family protein [Bacteroidaceae bacterium]|nr:TonB family protein [Bacteroidaceae bacterium]
MGSIVLYIMEWALALIVLLTIYKAAFSGTTLYRFNRFYLLGATLLSALLPLVHITIPEKTPVVSEMAIDQMEFAQELTGTFMFMDEPDDSVMADTPAPARKTSLWAVILVCMYSAYVIMLLTGWTRSIIRARKFLRGKNHRRISRTVWLVTHDEDFGPFSWMNYIVISDTEKGFARRASLRHEYSHVKLLHSADLVFLLACTILNPVCWLVLQEIKIVHEYEADNEVINRYGIRNSDYQKLLIMRTVGAEAYALASSFNLNIKKRIIMLNKNQTKKRRLIWLLILIPLLGTTSVLFARTELSIGTDSYDYNEFRIIIQGDKIGGQKLKWHSDNGIDECLAANEPSRLQLNEVGDYLDNSDIVKERVQKVTLVIWPNAPKETIDEIKTILRKKELLDIRYEEPPASLDTIGPQIFPYVGEELQFETMDNPEFPGGTDGLLEFMRTNIKYPADAREQNIVGRVLVTFIINKDGSIQEPEVVKSVHPSLDAEAVRLISSMPNWKPGIHRGKPVRTKYTLPVNFRLHSVETTLERPTWIFIDTMDKAASEQYVVMYEKGESPDSSTAESLESDIKDLFNGKRKFIQVPKSDENLKKVKEIIAKYPDKKVNWML